MKIAKITKNMASDEEIKKTFRLTVGEEGILYFEITGNVDDVAANVRQAELSTQCLKEALGKNPDQKFKCLVDLSAISKTAHYPSPQARQIFAETIDHKQLIKIAVIVPRILVQAVMNFILYAVNKKRKVKLFKTKKEALDWLKK